jgi:centrosomal protein CEP290
VRAQLQRLKNAERTVVDLTTGMSVEAKRQIDELQVSEGGAHTQA